jgi:hypothetical protein
MFDIEDILCWEHHPLSLVENKKQLKPPSTQIADLTPSINGDGRPSTIHQGGCGNSSVPRHSMD